MSEEENKSEENKNEENETEVETKIETKTKKLKIPKICLKYSDTQPKNSNVK